MSKLDENCGIVSLLLIWAVIILGVIGWIMNVIYCIGYALGHHADDSTAAMVIHIIGIPIAFIGAVLGWF